ncbi:MAG: guanylate kinase [Clostridiales bacterium]|nr:guanylate kinase [Clostridiales bacterium]
MTNDRGTLVVISGFSGAGKGTVSRKLVEEYGYSLSISATTRKPREGEQDGVDYFFKTEHEFLSLVDYNGYIEYAQYVGNYYGTPRKFVEDCLKEGRVVILEIEVQGAMNIRQQYPDAILLFITAPSASVLKNRLVGRGTEEPAVIAKRMCRAVEEAESISVYDYIVNNEEGRIEECVEQIHSIIESESCRVSRRAEFIAELKAGLAEGAD